MFSGTFLPCNILDLPNSVKFSFSATVDNWTSVFHGLFWVKTREKLLSGRNYVGRNHIRLQNCSSSVSNLLSACSLNLCFVFSTASTWDPHCPSKSLWKASKVSHLCLRGWMFPLWLQSELSEVDCWPWSSTSGSKKVWRGHGFLFKTNVKCCFPAVVKEFLIHLSCICLG